MAQSAVAPIWERRGLRQFVKFCLVGFTSMLIDVVISYTLVFHFHLNPTLSKTISFLFAVTNGFIWNSRWTFRGLGSGKRHEMYGRFLMVNCVGLVMNLCIFKTVLMLFTGRFIGQGIPTKPQFAMATGAAVVCVALWNFLANKKWTFNG